MIPWISDLCCWSVAARDCWHICCRGSCCSADTASSPCSPRSQHREPSRSPSPASQREDSPGGDTRSEGRQQTPRTSSGRRGSYLLLWLLHFHWHLHCHWDQLDQPFLIYLLALPTRRDLEHWTESEEMDFITLWLRVYLYQNNE